MNEFINKRNYIAMIFNILFILIIVILIISIKRDNGRINTLQYNRFDMVQLADRLRHSSDELTHFARTYVVTDDKKFKNQYFDVLNIRNGLKKRPKNYNTLYWDLDETIRKINHPDTIKISLTTLMSALPYSIAEKKKLSLSEKSSNELVRIEAEALNAMKGLYKDKSGGYSVIKPPNKKHAIKLMHSNEYYYAKHKIMSPIDDFMLMLNKRTYKETLEIQEGIGNKFLILFLIISIFVIGDIYIFMFIRKANKKINEKLQQDIDEKIEENSKKDKLLFEQSKLAAMGEMVGSIAHQWRQPLNAIAGHIQMIEYDHEDNLINDKYIKDFVVDNMNLVNYMSETIDDFRNFFRVDKTKKEFSPKQAILGTINLIKSQLKENDIEIKLEAIDNNKVLGFETEFQQVILNIINNAKDEFVSKERKGGIIDISIFNEMNFTVIKIGDNAGGIPEDIKDRIFEPYYTTKEQGKGTGLGLYMSKLIIEENMGGHLSVENGELGAVFTIVFVDITI